MPLTAHRPDGGFGPMYNGQLTTSFVDIVLVPLPCWIFLVLMVFFFATNSRKGNEDKQVTVDHEPKQHAEPSRIRRIWHGIVTFLLLLFGFGVLFLSIDEIIRLDRLGWGVGLLPFVPVCAFLAVSLHLSRHRLQRVFGHTSSYGTRFRIKLAILVLTFWVLMIIVECVKIHTLNELKKWFPRKDTKYPTSQQIMDVVILVICMALVSILTIMESIRSSPR
ncbi:hypothetical protein CPB86DRAFT_786103 [Serendipita vermifera]|nr:hypothetical protein CPB86DRAFT_786103 [Serendipita vermifera]